MPTTNTTSGQRRPAGTILTACYCGQLYTCDDCGGDVCACTCDIDGAPQTREEVTSGYVNPSQAKRDAWTQRLEARR